MKPDLPAIEARLSVATKDPWDAIDGRAAAVCKLLGQDIPALLAYCRELEGNVMEAKPTGETIYTKTARQTLTADEQIRMKALECASIIASGFASQPGAIGMRDDGEFWSKLEKFEDYLRNGR